MKQIAAISCSSTAASCSRRWRCFPSLSAVAAFDVRAWRRPARSAAVLERRRDQSVDHSISSRASRRRAGRTSCRSDQRIATFDNDGTLWIEQPMYVQLAFILDRVKALAPQHPDWKTKQPFKAVLDGDMKALAASGEKGLVELMAVTHAGMTTDEFAKIVSDWLATARDPRFKRPYTELVYQPMLELLAYLRANGFKTFIVSGGGIEFMRPWTERIYGIPPEQVVGSSIKTRFEMRDGQPMLFRLPEINFIDDKAGKPVGINEHIGRRPIAAFGNSDGDLEMLQWTTMSERRALRPDRPSHRRGARICLRPPSHFGKLDKALDAAAVNKWTVVDMKKDWKRVFAFD